jgi:hypothetical protein
VPELGYYAQIEGGIFGQPDGTDDPVSRAKLQEAATQANIRLAAGAVPASYTGHTGGPGNAQLGGPSSLPIIGWTAQNSTGPAFHTPYVPDHMGSVPDWNDDPNGIGAGAYDWNPSVGSMAPNPLGRAPIGGGLLQYDDRPNPNAPTTDVSGSGDLEW